MVTRSTIDYEKYKQEVYSIIKNKLGEKKAKTYISFIEDRYDGLGRSFIDYKLALSLLDDYHYCKRIGTRWYAFVGIGGSGKSTLAKNVFYFLDKSFTLDRIDTDMDKFIKIISSFTEEDELKSVYLDEPDDTIVSQSKKGKVLRKIFGKLRQQKMFLGICATDLKDIPPYIYRKLDGIFFCPYLGKYMFFKNRPKKKSYIIQQIRMEYEKLGYKVFWKLKNDSVGCLTGDTHKATPLDYQEKEYLKNKRKDYEQNLKEYLNTEKGISEKDERIIELVGQGLTDFEIATEIGNDRSYIGERRRNLERKGMINPRKNTDFPKKIGFVGGL